MSKMTPEKLHKLFDGGMLELGARLEKVLQSASMLAIVAMIQKESVADRELITEIGQAVNDLRDKVVARFGDNPNLDQLYQECVAITNEDNPVKEEELKGNIEAPAMSAGYL